MKNINEMKIMELCKSNIAVRYGLNTKNDIMNFEPVCVYFNISNNVQDETSVDVFVLLENNEQKKLEYSVYCSGGYIEEGEEEFKREVPTIGDQMSKIKENIKGLIFKYKMQDRIAGEINEEELYLFSKTNEFDEKMKKINEMKIMELGKSDIAIESKIETKEDLMNFIPFYQSIGANEYKNIFVSVVLENEETIKLDYIVSNFGCVPEDVYEYSIGEQIEKIKNIKGFIFNYCIETSNTESDDYEFLKLETK